MMTNPKIVTDQTAVDEKLLKLQRVAEIDSQKDRAKSLGLSFSDFSGRPIDPEALLIIKRDLAVQNRIACVYRNGASLILAAVDPENTGTKEVIESLKNRGYSPQIIITTDRAFAEIVNRYPASGDDKRFNIGSIDIDDNELAELERQVTTISDLKDKVYQLPITKLVEITLAGALKIGASDVHFEPENTKVRLRYRIDGVLQDVTDIEKETYTKVVNRIKIISKLKINISSKPQDGRFTIKQKAVAIEVRTSVLPSEYGETIVLRLLDPRSIKGKLEELGMRQDLLKIVTQQIQKPNGAILTTGPTGSGKTTALYAFINTLNEPGTKIITIEDPIEYHIEGISQTQVDFARDYTFSNGLRAIVRQDPDIILVGEIRDSETAEIALHAALTGHLVFSTLHTNDSTGAIPRLIDLGVKPQSIAPAISMIMAQRLVRRLCTACREESVLEGERLERVTASLSPLKERLGLNIDQNTKIFNPVGCEKCNNTGYKGRIGVFEAFIITPEISEKILEGVTNNQIKDAAIKQGMVTMIQDAYLRLIEGVTSIDEIERVLGT